MQLRIFFSLPNYAWNFRNLLFFFLVSTMHLPVTAQQNNTLEECEKLINKGMKSMDRGDYPKALEYFAIGEVMAKKNQWNKQLFVIQRKTATTYQYLSNYGVALGYNRSALEISENEPSLEAAHIATLNDVGIIFSYENDYPSALEYYKKAYPMAWAIKSDYLIVLVASNMADVYNDMGKYKEAYKYLMEVRDVPMANEQKHFWTINYAETLALEGRIDEAENIAKDMIDEVEKKKIEGCYVCITELLATIYSRSNKTSQAIYYAKKGLQNTDEMKNRIRFYNQLSELYHGNKQYELSKQYKDSVIIAKDSLNVLVNRGLFQNNKVKLKIQEYQNDNERYEAERKFLILGIILSLLLCLLVYKWLKSRIIKQKREKIIAENNQKIIDLEMDNLKNNIAERNRKLSTKALYFSGRNELIEEVINSLSHIPEVSNNNEVSNYLNTLKGYLKTDAQWDDFINYFEQVNHDFFKTLRIRHPQLSPNDIRFLCYIYMNMDIKEISAIFSITSEAGRKRKQRIAKKMGVEVDDLHDYIFKIN